MFFVSKRRKPIHLLLLALLFLLASCEQSVSQSVASTSENIIVYPSPSDSEITQETTSIPILTDTPTDPELILTTSPGTGGIKNDDRDPQDWKNWPVVPDFIDPSMISLYQEGQLFGNDEHHFSKIGDCQSVKVYYLSGFDDPSIYVLGAYSSLQETINWFSGQFLRESAAVRGGMNVAAIQNTLFTKSTEDAECISGETPLECEIRTNNPSIVIVSYEELFSGDTEKFEKNYRALIDALLERKIVPILATTATNEPANEVVAKLAVEYHLPVWNLWSSLQSMNDKGVIEDNFHLTRWGNIFNFTEKPVSGWHARNRGALRSLDMVWRMLNQ